MSNTGNVELATGALSHLSVELDTRPFKVLGRQKDCAQFVKWGLLNEEMAQENHGQTLTRLNQRGGLGVEEIWANVNKLSPYDCPDVKTAVALVNSMSV